MEGSSTRAKVTWEQRLLSQPDQASGVYSLTGTQSASSRLPYGPDNATGQSCLYLRKLEETKFDPGPVDLVDREDRLPEKKKASPGECWKRWLPGSPAIGTNSAGAQLQACWLTIGQQVKGETWSSISSPALVVRVLTSLSLSGKEPIPPEGQMSGTPHKQQGQRWPRSPALPGPSSY